MTKSDQNGKHPEDKNPEEHAETAREKVLREIRDAKPRDAQSPEESGHRGEAGDAITPNTEAQEQSQGD
ncbi:hypothetical protein SSP24_02230 [Streptomyces spinoverrucosus]|uniref:Uncharacterized protein n=1 Tax=Streptomyces spinoverrucosus TaxID=284043 RepID=A0A4Y3V8Y9_9ACTN|nr:hypothetical protein [Streptomyces spinoverrucosus]GEC02568.1 hypothetical protein SSP24_02230 [Streptomyces spinoverrucosus]GHB42102.1 hypothetical protein GCM10010397_10360 [Streptomyces spinoverrucosus]